MTPSYSTLRGDITRARTGTSTELRLAATALDAIWSVCDYETGVELAGRPSAALVEASLAEGDTGAVAAYESCGVWYPLDIRDRTSDTPTVYVRKDILAD